MDLTRLSYPDQAFDAVAATFVFGCIPDEAQLPALREVARVCRPGGEIRLLDYVGEAYRHGRHPDRSFARPTAKLLREIADELEL